MAIYSLNLGFISRSAGRSSVGFSAYIGAARHQDERTGVVHNYGCKNDVVVSRVLAPEDAPTWAKNPSVLWNKVEQFEDEIASLRFRGDAHNPQKNQRSLEAKDQFLSSAQTAQTIMGAIPLEFTQLEAEACVEEFLLNRFVSRGLVVEYAIHWDKGNPHFHGMITRRPLKAQDFSQRKDREIVSKAEHNVTRKQWEVVVNKHLELSGHEVRIDSRSYEDQGLVLPPTAHEGWYAQHLAEKGQYSRIVTDNEVIRQRNIELICENPDSLVHEVALKRTTFIRKHLEDEIIRRVGVDEKLFALLRAKVEGVSLPSDLILKQTNENCVYEGLAGTKNEMFAVQLQKVASQFTDQLLENKDISFEVGENLNREQLYSSRAYKEQEDKIIKLADVLHHREGKSVSQEIVSKVIEARESELGFTLLDEQKDAIAHFCSGPDIRLRPLYKNHVWSYDFVSDRLSHGKKIRMLTVIDEYTRECLSIHVDYQLKSDDVIDVLSTLFLTKGIPEYIRSDNGSEFTAEVLQEWLKELDVKTAYIEPGSPWENGYNERFNASLRNECLNLEYFHTLKEAKVIIGQWIDGYNHIRPHSSLGYRPPAPFIRMRIDQHELTRYSAI